MGSGIPDYVGSMAGPMVVNRALQNNEDMTPFEKAGLANMGRGLGGAVGIIGTQGSRLATPGGGATYQPQTGGGLMAPAAAPGGIFTPRPDRAAMDMQDKQRAQQKALGMMTTPGATPSF